jgi:catechol 2,3-dioxygenase-like lactoylglutathione lyase family enzyme/predicted enzyme related to lactoylglutathione lyase
MKPFLSRLIVVMLAAACAPVLAAGTPEGVGPVLWQPSMNLFRRYSSDPEALFAFYGGVLGFEQLTTFNVGGATGVARIQAGATQLKFTGQVPGRSYVPGGVADATGVRLWTFFFSDEAALTARFEKNGWSVPEFVSVPGTKTKSAVLADPDGQPVQLIITGDPAGTQYDEVEVGLTVSDIEASRAFYRDFVGLEELDPVQDTVFGTTKYPFRHGATIVSLRSFGKDLPADTGTGGIQYVVSNVDRVDELARERNVSVDQPLSTLGGFQLRTIWLDDPDGITNYFAETAQSRTAAK